MTPKEEATELFDKMCQTISDNCEHSSYCTRKECKWKGMIFCNTAQKEAKQCALISVDEIILSETDILNFMHCFNDKFEAQQDIDFWQQVKIEIEKL